MYRKDFKKKQDPKAMPKFKPVQMADIPPLVTYRNIAKVQLTNEKAKEIKDRLKLDSEALSSYTKRTQNEDYFISYDYNPFSLSVNKSQNEEEIMDVKNTHNYLDEVNEVQKQQIIKLKLPKTNILDEMVNTNHKERPMQKTLDLETMNKIEKYIKINEQKVSNQRQGENKDRLKVHINFEKNQQFKLKIDQEIEKQMELDEILTMRDENYFEKNIKIDNLFILVFGRDKQLKTNMDILDEKYFCFDSVKDSSKKNSFPIYRDISQFARKCSRNLATKDAKADILLDNEMNLGTDDYNFHTIMGMASGRLTSSDMGKMMKDGNPFMIKNDNKASQIDTEQEIYYLENTDNKVMNHINPNQYIDEHRLFVKYPYTKEEQNRLRQITDMYMQMKQKSLNIQHSIQKNVLDVATLAILQGEKAEKLDNIINYNPKVFKSKDEQVRISKINKTRDEVIKVKALSQALKLQKESTSMLKRVTKKKKKVKRTVTTNEN